MYSIDVQVMRQIDRVIDKDVSLFLSFLREEGGGVKNQPYMLGYVISLIILCCMLCFACVVEPHYYGHLRTKNYTSCNGVVVA